MEIDVFVKAKVLYTYSVNKTQTWFALMAYLENASNLTLTSYIEKSLAATTDYSTRYPMVSWNPIGVLIASGSLQPIQATASAPIELTTSTTPYTAYIAPKNTVTWSGASFASAVAMSVAVATTGTGGTTSTGTTTCAAGYGWNGTACVVITFTPTKLAVSAGQAGDTCVIKANGTVWCWGYNARWSLGNGTTTDSSVPVQVSSLTNVTSVGAGGMWQFEFNCALKTDGTVWCWGWNGDSEIGNTNAVQSQTIPLQATGATNIVSIGVGGGHVCAIKSDNSVWCWGRWDWGQRGDGTYNSGPVPTQVQGLTGVSTIGGGVLHTCALKVDGTVWCWGANSGGQLGDGTTTQRLTPVQVSGLTNAISLSTGYSKTCALKTDGTVWCWGQNNHGQLGNNSTTDSSVPVQVNGLTNVVNISGSCAIKSDGTTWCWGENGNGQLGNNSTTDSSVPVQVSGLTGILNIASANGWNACALKNNSTYWCWGWNIKGQLGDGTTTQRLTPVQVTAF